MTRVLLWRPALVGFALVAATMTSGQPAHARSEAVGLPEQALSSASRAAAEASPLAHPGVPTTYVVQAKDTLSSLARRYGVSVDAVFRANNMTDANVLKEGQRLRIPGRVDALPPPLRRGGAPSPSRSPSPALATQTVPTIEWPTSIGPPRFAVTTPFRPVPTSHELGRHDGIDIAAPGGAAIRAAASGTVTQAAKGWNGGYGWIVVIDHGNNISTRYAHLSELSVAVGERVRMGRKIGAVGSTGLSTGPHLHFELRLKGTPLDPLLTLP